jgi:hypothetical protein
MSSALALSLLTSTDGDIRLARRQGEVPRPVGPSLRTSVLGANARAYAIEVFEGAGEAGADPVEAALARAEQLTLDRIYAGQASARDAAAARTVILWAGMAIHALTEQVDDLPGEAIERRINRLLGLAGGDGPAPLSLSEPAPIVEERRLSHDMRGIAKRLAIHIERSRVKATDGRNEPGRAITLQPFQNRWAIFYEIAASIAFTTFASAGSFVFLGVRLQKCNGRCNAGGITGFSASLDIIALVICSFGFLFATLSYANATGVLARLSTMNYSEALERGNRVSEYFGVYPLILAIPLAVEGSTSSPIPLIVKLVGVVAFVGYHWAPRFSLLERVIADDGLGSDRARGWTVLGFVVLLLLTWFGPSIDSGEGGLWIRVAASALFLLMTCAIYMIAALTPEQMSSSRYRVHGEDILGDESPSRDSLTPRQQEM